MGAPHLATLPGAVTLGSGRALLWSSCCAAQSLMRGQDVEPASTEAADCKHSTPGCTFKYLEWLRIGPTLFPRARFFVLGDDDIYLSFGHLQASRPSLPPLQPHVPATPCAEPVAIRVQADLHAVAAITREDELVLYGLCAARVLACLACAWPGLVLYICTACALQADVEGLLQQRDDGDAHGLRLMGLFRLVRCRAGACACPCNACACAPHVRSVLIRDGPAVSQRRTMHKCRAAMARRAMRDRAAATLPPSRPLPTLSAVAELSEASLLMERAATRAMTPLARAELERRAATARAAAAAAQQAYDAELLHTCTWMHTACACTCACAPACAPACAQAHDAELLRSAEYTVCTSTCKSAHCKSSCESSSSAQPTAVNSSAAPSAAWLDELLLGQARACASAWHVHVRTCAQMTTCCVGVTPSHLLPQSSSPAPQPRPRPRPRA